MTEVEMEELEKDEAVAARAKAKVQGMTSNYKERHWPHWPCIGSCIESEGLLYSDIYCILKFAYQAKGRHSHTTHTMSMLREYARCQHLLPGCRPYHNESLQARITRETKLHSLFTQEWMAMLRESIQKTKVATRGWLL